ncbi:MAG: cytochrome ubiquinol oxidase subunit I, partial [Candidatus Aminicenantaceae bacterium]
LIHFNSNAEVLGLNEFPENERPPVFLPFATYHIMIFSGMVFILMSIMGLYLLIRKKLWDSKWYLRFLLFSIPLAYLSNESGWIAAEVGRQPWAVYKILKTADAVSTVVPAGNILFSLLMFTAVYTLLAIIGISIILKIIKKGPDELVSSEIKGDS